MSCFFVKSLAWNAVQTAGNLLLLVSTSINQSWMWPWTFIKNELILWFCWVKSFDGDLVEIGLLLTIVYLYVNVYHNNNYSSCYEESAEENVFFALMQPFNNRCGLLSFIVIDQCLQCLTALKIQNIILSLACYNLQNTNCDEMQNCTRIL